MCCRNPKAHNVPQENFSIRRIKRGNPRSGSACALVGACQSILSQTRRCFSDAKKTARAEKSGDKETLLHRMLRQAGESRKDGVWNVPALRCGEPYGTPQYYWDKVGFIGDFYVYPAQRGRENTMPLQECNPARHRSASALRPECSIFMKPSSDKDSAVNPRARY